MANTLQPQPSEDLLQQADQVVKPILAEKFRVHLRKWPDGRREFDYSDGRQQNQDAQDVYSKVMLELLTSLDRAQRQTRAPIADIRKYAATVTYNAFSEWVRETDPEWSSLKNRLRYFCGHRLGFAEWIDQGGQILSGFAGWQNQGRTEPDAQAVAVLRSDPQSVLPDVLIKQVDQMKPDDWERLLGAIFKYLDAPLPLNSLVAVVATLAGVKPPKGPANDEGAEEGGPIIETPEPGQTPEADAALYQMLRRLWVAIQQVPLDKRRAYLLNPTGIEIDVFTFNGIATIQQIGAAIELSDQHYERLWSALPLDEEARLLARNLHLPEKKFAMLWAYLPLEDNLIARLLEVARQRVINLRASARAMLARHLTDYL
jgi:hypothetical protein